ncbi:MAG: phosphopentomutase [Ruminococcaceae bacterium]|nr:phosphopentomutase [Oscillospiraceae bacterium]
MSKRVFLIVLDSVGIGALPDAKLFGDEGSNTLRAVRSHPDFNCPNLERLGLFNIESVEGGVKTPLGCYARMAEASMGKDTTVGHFEIAGVICPKPLPTYPEGFPPEVIEEFEKRTGYGVLCNRPYSGTEVIRDYGREHLATGKLIVYTSADSVFQIAAHEDRVSIEELYRVCEIARRMLVGEHGVGRVIARPFAGEHPFYRTSRRHDYSLEPPAWTLPDLVKAQGMDSISVGKIYDIFAGRGFTASYRTANNKEGMQAVLSLVKSDFEGLCFVNLVDFDMVYGHRNDVSGYAKALNEFDTALGELMPQLRKDDLLVITADHGCDPSTPSTDHSREYTPLLVYGNSVKSGVNLGTRETFADIAATLSEYLGLQERFAGQSFLKEIRKD